MAKATVHSSTQRNETMRHTPGSALEVDEVVVVNGRVCIAHDDIAAGEEGSLIHSAEGVTVPKAAVTVAEGETAYYHSGNDNFTNDATGATKCGMFLAPAASGDAEAEMRLDNSATL